MKYFLCGLFAVLVLATCAGCTAREDEDAGSCEVVADGQIRLCTLPDGTRCAGWDGYKSGGLDCSFTSRSVE